ncbi:metallo proteinase 10 [Macrolepiota fuliginosa MF-IS2]|uniref:Extracellular metalloproteinase n=1 Tax=Macrolepiota fuliginosa MF-IS2 TaxID=1400762 RepID=A0A9P6BWQ4_9AGAR|nr:metallo proteinase 10 [Macrolepiota fuliginosa MF-IS2]
MAIYTSSSFIRSFILVIILYSSVVGFISGAPWPASVKHSTHYRRFYKRGLALEVYHPKSTFKTYSPAKTSNSSTPSFSEGNGSSFASVGDTNSNATWQLDDSAMGFVSSELGINKTSVRYHKGWSSANGKFAYMRQYIGGVPVANAVANVVYSDTSQVVSFGSSFVDTKGVTVAPSTPTVEWKDVLPGVEELFNGTRNGAAPGVEYLVKEDGSLALAHVMQIENPDTELWVEAFVCAHSGEVLSVTDFIAHATFNVVPIQKQNFFDGREFVVNPEDLQASPQGWFGNANPASGIERGNNAVIFVNGSSSSNGQRVSFTPDANNISSHAYDVNSPLDAANLGAVADNAFYVMNVMHDVSYRYGFREEQGNFQNNNFGKGGVQGDSVQVSVDDTSGVNNANFATPPIGQAPVARFFFFKTAEDLRDPAMSNDIMIHEYTHGITGRMIGGGTSRCLQTVESGGMGEGYSDMMAAWVAQTSDQVEDYKIGTYINANGIRSHPYSTNGKVNPLKYSDAAKLNEVHAIGEIWANTLFNVYADLVGERGFASNAMTEPDGLEGNVVFMRNLMDSLLLAPCNPTMLQARDAILAADNVRYNGANMCTIWGAFARKGMGVDAQESFVDGFSVPAGCNN